MPASATNPPLTITQAAKRWNVSTDFIRQEIARNNLPAYRAGRVIRVHCADLDALFAPIR